MAKGRLSQFLYERALKAPFFGRLGVTDGSDGSYSNSFARKAMSADNTADIEIHQVDADNNLRIGGESINPARSTINFPLATNASIATQCFFIAPTAMTITAISCEFETADGATNTGFVTHETGKAVPGTGATCMVGTFNLNATAKTVQNAVLPSIYPSSSQSVSPAVLNLAAGDRLSFKMASAVTSLAGLVISIAASPGSKGPMAAYVMNANGDLTTQSFFLANRPLTIQKIQVVWAVKSSSGTSTIDITKDVSTNAPGAGTTCLTATVDATAVANTVTTPALTATAATLTMAAGDRLSVKFAGAGQVALAGVVVVVWFQPIYQRKEVSFVLAKNANLATQPFFIADRDYDVVDLSEVHATASGGGGNVAVTIDSGTTAAGGGLVVQTDNANAGFSLAGTANTVQVGTTATMRNRILTTGSRLSAKFASPASTAGVTITVSLIPR